MGNIPFDVLMMSFESFEDELEKIAKARWVKEVGKGRVSLRDMLRSGADEGAKMHPLRGEARLHANPNKKIWRFDQPEKRTKGGIAAMAEQPRDSFSRKLQMLERSPNAPSIYNR